MSNNTSVKSKNKNVKPRPRPPKRPSATLRQPSQASIAKLIDTKIQQATARPDIGVDGARWLSCVTNPFGSAETGGALAPSRIPDPDSTPTFLFRETGSTTFLGSTATQGLIQLVGYSCADQALQVLYGASVTDMTASQTTVAETTSIQTASLNSTLSTGAEVRVVTAGLRVAPMTLDTASGSFRGYEADYLGRTAAASYCTNITLLRQPCDPIIYSIKDGITVRRSCDSEYEKYKVGNTNIYTGTINAVKNNHGKMPLIQFWGLSATTVLTISWSILYEVRGYPDWPNVAESGPFEPEYTQLVHMANSIPTTASGNSFKSFLRSFLGAGKKAVSFAYKNRDEIMQVGRLVSTVL